jgi:hypothetical protein
VAADDSPSRSSKSRCEPLPPAENHLSCREQPQDRADRALQTNEGMLPLLSTAPTPSLETQPRASRWGRALSRGEDLRNGYRHDALGKRGILARTWAEGLGLAPVLQRVAAPNADLQTRPARTVRPGSLAAVPARAEQNPGKSLTSRDSPPHPTPPAQEHRHPEQSMCTDSPAGLPPGLFATETRKPVSSGQRNDPPGPKSTSKSHPAAPQHAPPSDYATTGMIPPVHTDPDPAARRQPRCPCDPTRNATPCATGRTAPPLPWIYRAPVLAAGGLIMRSTLTVASSIRRPNFIPRTAPYGEKDTTPPPGLSETRPADDSGSSGSRPTKGPSESPLRTTPPCEKGPSESPLEGGPGSSGSRPGTEGLSESPLENDAGSSGSRPTNKGPSESPLRTTPSAIPDSDTVHSDSTMASAPWSPSSASTSDPSPVVAREQSDIQNNDPGPLPDSDTVHSDSTMVSAPWTPSSASNSAPSPGVARAQSNVQKNDPGPLPDPGTVQPGSTPVPVPAARGSSSFYLFGAGSDGGGGFPPLPIKTDPRSGPLGSLGALSVRDAIVLASVVSPEFLLVPEALADSQEIPSGLTGPSPAAARSTEAPLVSDNPYTDQPRPRDFIPGQEPSSTASINLREFSPVPETPCTGTPGQFSMIQKIPESNTLAPTMHCARVHDPGR